MQAPIIALCTALIICISQAQGAVFDWERPCTLAPSSEILPSCTNCGSGNTATPQPACMLADSTIPVGTTVQFKYHSSTHNLWVGPSKCSFATEICPSAPCSYTFKTKGTFWVSDKIDNYCTNFGATKKYIVT